jgi:hypothetical protein
VSLAVQSQNSGCLRRYSVHGSFQLPYLVSHCMHLTLNDILIVFQGLDGLHIQV